MKLKEIQHKLSSTDLESKTVNLNYNYKGVPMFCALGVHEKAFEMMGGLNLKKSDPILILGAGAGAFDRRLLDNGFTDITSVEFVEGVHMVEGVKLLNLDLNQDFDNIGRFKLIVALEVIEHLENQFHFIRQIKKVFIDSDSHLILSSPNTESTFSRFKYFVSGRLQYFSNLELLGTGHISPIFSHILKYNLSENDLIIKSESSNGTVWKNLFAYPNYIIRAFYYLSFVITRFILNKNDKEINLYLIGGKGQQPMHLNFI